MISFVFMKKVVRTMPDKFKSVYYRRYADEIFVLIKSRNHLIKFRDYLNKYHPNIKFSFEEEKNGKLSFLDVEVSLEKETSLLLLSIANQLLVVPTRTLIVFYLPHTNLAWLILWFADVFQFVPTGLTFIMS